MRSGAVAAKNIDDYIDNAPSEVQDILKKMRATIAKAAPDATEKISYGMPTFFLNGNLVHFAAFKNHIGLYPTASGTEEFAKQLAPYETGKGSIQFPLGKPIPYALVTEIVKFRVAASERKANAKVSPKAAKKTAKKAAKKSR